MYLRLATSRRGQGVGSGLLRTLLEVFLDAEFRAILFGGTEDPYNRLGFSKSGGWDTHLSPRAIWSAIHGETGLSKR